MTAVGLLAVLALQDGYLAPDQARTVEVKAAPPAAASANIAVVLFEFEDQKRQPKALKAVFEAMFFSHLGYSNQNALNQQVLGSVADWIDENSRGAAKVNGKVIDWVTLDIKWADVKSGMAGEEILDRAFWKAFARDGPKALADVTHVFFVYAGRRAEAPAAGGLAPHVGTVEAGGKRWRAAVLDCGVTDKTGNPKDDFVGVGAAAHMLGHLLGLRDHAGAGAWCAMSPLYHPEAAPPQGAPAETDRRPVHLCAVCKSELGWVRPAAVDPRAAQKLLLRPVERHPDAFLVQDVVLESRARQGFDRRLPGEGLLAWRVNKGRPADLVAAHGDSIGRFEAAVPFPTLLNRGLEPGIRNVSMDERGFVTFETAAKEDRSAQVSFESRLYRTLPRGTSPKAATVAILGVEFEDAPLAEAPFRRMAEAALDYLGQASHGALAAGPVERKRLSGKREDFLKRKPGEFEESRGDWTLIVFAGAAKAGTLLSRHAGKKYAAVAEGAEPGVAVQAVFELIGATVLGDRGWCLSRPAKGGGMPSYPCAWCREKVGWLKPLEVRESGLFALAPASAFPGQAVKLPVGEGEYYLIENRERWEADRGLPSSGLVVWHVTPREKACTDCWERGALDVWHVHGDVKPPRAASYTPFVLLSRVLSIRLAGGRFEVADIKPDTRGNLYFEVVVK
jgi:M6 family metalloprotease-like protein